MAVKSPSTAQEQWFKDMLASQTRALFDGANPLWLIRRLHTAIDSLILFMESEGYDTTDIDRAREYLGNPTPD